MTDDEWGTWPYPEHCNAGAAARSPGGPGLQKRLMRLALRRCRTITAHRSEIAVLRIGHLARTPDDAANQRPLLRRALMSTRSTRARTVSVAAAFGVRGEAFPMRVCGRARLVFRCFLWQNIWRCKTAEYNSGSTWCGTLSRRERPG